MFDMRSLTKRYFEVTLPNGVSLHVEPPRMKMLMKMLSLSKKIQDIEVADGEIGLESLSALTDALSVALSKNKEKRTITEDDINEQLDLLEMMELFTNYFNWVGEINNSKN